MSFTAYRTARENTQVKRAVLPAAAGNSTYGSFDLGGTTAQCTEAQIGVDIPALTAYTDNTKSLTISVEDSADGSSWAANAKYGSQTHTGVATVGTSAAQFRWPIHPDTRRYARVKIAAASGGPDVTASYVIACVC